MTHLSDYSFLQRATSLSYLFIWYSYRVWSLDGFKCVRISKFKQGELKGIVTLLLFFMIPFQLVYEITSCRVKYDEGFVKIFDHYFSKPETMWTEADRNLIIPTDYSLCIGFSLQTGTLLLLQCFWNYLANSVAKANFMSSKEFKLYIIWTCLTIIIFPVLQFNFSRSIYNYTYKEVIPELVYGCGLFIIAVLGIRSHYRFNQLLMNSKHSMNSRYVSNKILYFQELNFILTIALFFFSISLIILCSDGLTGPKKLNVHKFSSDFLICNTNVASIVVWAVVILIFHPKKPSESQQGSRQQQQLVTPNSNLSNRHGSAIQQQEALMTTTTSMVTTTTTTSTTHTPYAVASASQGHLPYQTQALSIVHSNATTLVPSTNQHLQQEQHLQQQQHWKQLTSHCPNHQDIDPRREVYTMASSSSLLVNDSNISSTSRDPLCPVTDQSFSSTNIGRVSNNCAAYDRDSSVFTSRQPLVQGSNQQHHVEM